MALFIQRPHEHIVLTSSLTVSVQVPLTPCSYAIHTLPTMSPTLRSTAPTIPRLDLSQDQLLHLCIFYIYLSPSTEIVARLLNRRFKPKWKLTAKNVEETYLHLHDTQHAIWTRAKDMNREEKVLLKNTLTKFGVDNRLLNVNIIKAVAPMARMRVIRQSADSSRTLT